MVHEPTTQELIVEGMTCDHCVRAVHDELSQVAGVTSVDVDLASGRVQVAATRPIGAEVLAAAVDEAGYTVAGVAT